MRRRRHLRGPWFLLGAMAVSAGLHGLLGLQLQAWLPALLASSKKTPPPRKPVEVVRLTPDAFERVLNQARRAVPPKTEAEKKREEKAKKEREKKQREEKGQIVEVPASKDKRRPDNARFLARENSRVERETVARHEDRDETKKRVTNRLQDKSSRAQQLRGTPVPGLEATGDGGKVERNGKKGKGDQKRRRFKLEVPRLQRKESVNLDIAELPELEAGRILNRRRQPELPGRSDRLELGRDRVDEDARERRLGEKGAKNGLPTLEQLRPTLGTIARISGSPSDDYIENVPEGDGTFLNTREFKYATFFYQIRDSVRPFWRSDIRREMRRRDPAGNIYGPGDLKTLLFIRLDDAGKLSEVRVAKSSGYEFLDHVAIRAFQQAESFPNPPAGIVDEDGNINFHFAFVLYTGRRSLGLFR